jgi:predicted house-cleaning noncanonical NTP pyrophosphatase (MazG superfamily)
VVRFNLQKIIRSKLPLKFDSEGIGYRVRYLVGPKYVEELIKKLKEEIDELTKAETPFDKAMEAGDIIQVIYGFANYYSFETGRLSAEDTGETLEKVTQEFVNSIENNDEIPKKAQQLISKVLHYIQPIEIQQVEEQRLSKLGNHGDFNNGVFLEYMDLPEDDPRVETFLKDPEKYRQINSE